jgi:HK97 family phage portal protein
MILDFLSADTSVSDLTNPRYWLTDWANGQATASGERVTATTSLALSAYYACIKVLSEDVGKLPFKVYKELSPRGKEVVRDHPAYRVLHRRPNPWMSAMTFRMTLQAHVCGWGSGYAEIQRTQGGEIEALWLIHPSRVTVLVPQASSGSVAYQVKNNDGATTLLPQESMFHIRGLGPDGLSGYSVAALGAESLGLALAAQRYGATFFANGASLSGVLEHPGELKSEAKDYLRTSWAQMYSGASNTGKTAVLEEGMKFSKISIPPEDAQFIETRQFAVEEITRWFRMPPHKIQHLLHATFSNIEHQGLEYVTDTLMPWLILWEQEADAKLLNGDEDLYTKHVVLGLLRGDAASRAAYYSTMFQIGGLSQNDMRELDDQNPIGPDGDVYYVPSNLTRSEDAAQGMVASSGARPPQDPPVAAPPADGDEEPEEDPEEKTDPPKDEEDPQAAALAALRPVILDACGRIVRRDAKAFAASVKKREADRVSWVAWRNEWTGAQVAVAVEWSTSWAVAVAGVSVLWERGSSIPSVASTLGPIMVRYAEESARLGGEQSAEEIETWPETRAPALATALEEAVKHVLCK